MTKRIEWIDIAKGIAILFVIVGHSLGAYGGGFITNVIFAFHMPIFFILSGYLYHPKNVNKNIKDGTFNLLFPYLFTSLLILIVSMFALKIKNFSVLNPFYTSIKQATISIIYGAGSVPVNPFHFAIKQVGALWFLIAMFFSIQIFNIIMKLTYSIPNNFIKRLLCFSMISALGTFLTNVFVLPFSLNAAFLSTLFLFVGYCIRQYDVLNAITLPYVLILLVFWLATSKKNFFLFMTASSTNIYISVITAIFASICVIKFCIALQNNSKFQITNRILTWYGKNSLAILCFHLLDMNALLITNHVYAMPISPLAHTIILTIYRIIIASFLTLLVSKVPFIRSFYFHRKFSFFSFRTKYKKKQEKN